MSVLGYYYVPLLIECIGGCMLTVCLISIQVMVEVPMLLLLIVKHLENMVCDSPENEHVPF